MTLHQLAKNSQNNRRAPLTDYSAATSPGATSSPRRGTNAQADRRQQMVEDRSVARFADLRRHAVDLFTKPATDVQFHVCVGIAAPMVIAIVVLIVSAIPYL